LEERRLKLGQYLFMRHGGKVVFFGRFVAVLRAWAAFLAGINRVRWPRFFALQCPGGIVWATLYRLGGYLLGDNVHQLAGPIGIVRRNEQRLADEAERALPEQEGSMEVAQDFV
jgi:membrane protein DedA with SNARE-associated domain